MSRLLYACCLVPLLECSSMSQPGKVELPANPKIESLIKQLGSKDDKERIAAESELRAEFTAAYPYLRAAYANANPELTARLSKVIASRGRKLYTPKMLEGAKEFARIGKIELAMEQLLAIEPPAYDLKYWQAVLDVSSIVREKAVQFYQKDFDKPVLPAETTVEDFIRNRRVERFQWESTRFDATHSGMDFTGCVRANQVVSREMKGIVICFGKSEVSPGD